MKSITAIALSCVALLAGCGGGGGGDSSSATPSSVSMDSKAEGAYAGTLTGSASSEFQMLVLDDGSFWTLYGSSSSSAFYVSGFVQGKGTFENGKLVASNAKDFGYSPAVSGAVTGTYTATPTIAGAFATSAGTATFSGGTIPNSTYNYKTAATISAIAGSWNAILLSGETVSLNISDTGAIGGVSSWGCSYTGSVLPRASGKNVFNLTLSFGGSPCALPNQTASGLAITYPLGNGKSQLIFAAIDSTRTYGSAGMATR